MISRIKKIIIGIIIVVLAIAVAVFIYNSKKESALTPQVSSTTPTWFDFNTAGATTTVKFNGYDISLWRSSDTSDYRTVAEIVDIRDKNGHVVFSDASTVDFTPLPPNWTLITKADDFITESIKAITGNGTPYLTFANWSNIHNCYNFNIIGLGAIPKILLNEEHCENNWPELINNGAGKPMSLQDRNGIYYTIKTYIGGGATISTSSLY